MSPSSNIIILSPHASDKKKNLLYTFTSLIHVVSNFL